MGKGHVTLNLVLSVLWKSRVHRFGATNSTNRCDYEITKEGRISTHNKWDYSTMLVVGIDPSLGNTGVVLLQPTGEFICGVNSKMALKDWAKQPKAIKNEPVEQAQRLNLVGDFVIGTITQLLPIDFAGHVHIGYEHYSFDSTNRPFALGELGGVLKSRLIKLPGKVTLAQVAPTKLKLFATGNGAVGKEPVMAQAKYECEALGKLTKASCTSDVCDAYFLAKFAWYQNCPELVVKHEQFKDQLRRRLELVNLKGKK